MKDDGTSPGGDLASRSGTDRRPGICGHVDRFSNRLDWREPWLLLRIQFLKESKPRSEVCSRLRNPGPRRDASQWMLGLNGELCLGVHEPEHQYIRSQAVYA